MIPGATVRESIGDPGGWAVITGSRAVFQLLEHRARTPGNTRPQLGPHSLSWAGARRDPSFKVKLRNTLGLNPQNQAHTCLLENSVLLGLAVKISWVNVGIYRVSFLVALMGFKIFNS